MSVRPTAASIAAVRLGTCLFDPVQRTLASESEQVPISPLGCRLLEALAEADGAIVTRTSLIESLWDGNYLVGEVALNRLVSETRRAMGALPGTPDLIQTVPRKGYRLVSPGAAAPPSAPQGWTWRRWLGTAALLIPAAALLHWLIEGLTGLVWALRQNG